MDVLAYSAFNQQVRLNQDIIDKTDCLSTKCIETAERQAIAASFDAASVCWVKCIEPCLLRKPESTSYWSCIPDLENASGGFKVCDTSSYKRCNSSCTWTVPEGVTRARFQIWGAGGGSGAGHCCGGSPFGASGAYASVIIPVTEGCVYCLCAGCAYCCYPSRRAEGRMPGCPSWVAGFGLCNFCANGGPGRIGTWMAAYGRPNTCRLAYVTCNSSGPCLCCRGSHYCFANSCATCGIIPFVPGATYFGTTTSADSPSLVYGVRGMFPFICFDTNHYGVQYHPPIPGVLTNCCGFSWSSGTCCGKNCQACCGYLQVPGAGGWATIGMGGSYGTCGDAGRMGMVCVTYC